MNKAELLADIESKALKVIATSEEPDAVKNAANVRMYITNVMEQRGDVIQGRNIGWYTVDEGTGSEAAFYRDQVVHKNNARAAVQTYIDSLVPGTYIRATLLDVNEENLSAEATAVKNNGDGTAKKVQIFLYKNGGTPIQHIELV